MGELNGRKSKTNRTSLVCQYCENVFYPKSGHLKQKTCSRICGHKLRIKNGGTKKGKHYPHLRKARVGKCKICGKEFRAIKDFGDRKQKYCSVECYQREWTDNIQPNIKRASIKGEYNYGWKGDGVGYSGLHKWVARELGEPSKCEHCGTTEANKYEWANIDHLYKRNLNDWIRLCTKCHRKHDYENN